MITQAKLKELLSYDADTGIFTRLVTTSHNARAGDIAGTRCKRLGYCKIHAEGAQWLSHRLAWLYAYGEFPTEQIDHINGVRSDNRLENLRAVSNAENHKNLRLQKNNVSGAAGVSWKQKEGKWQASINIGGIKKYLGLYGDLELASLVRSEAELKYGFHINHGAESSE
jgi:hypothetical protein